jgi:sulfate/thiosulfate transport system substrate-binding protein
MLFLPNYTEKMGYMKKLPELVGFFAVSGLLLWQFAVADPSTAGTAETKPPAEVELLNVSYDPTREFYEAYNAWFAQQWKEKNGQNVSVRQSHGGSAKQARSVMDGLRADVVTLALAHDIDVIAKRRRLLPETWQEAFPHNSTPFYSVIVFLVRKGNPKGIHDWDDLVRSDVKVIMPNPKTSGGARWNYLAAWAYASKTFGGDEARTQEFMRTLIGNIPVLDGGARAATTTFVQRGMGDVLISWENEAYLAEKDIGKGQFEVVVPSLTIRAEPPVAVVTKNTEKKGTTAVASAYLQGLFEPFAQRLAAQHHYRPTNPEVAAEWAERFPAVKMVTIEEFGGWEAAHLAHFAEGASFDHIYGVGEKKKSK